MDYYAENPVAENTAAVGMSEQSDVVNAADLYTPEANGAAETDAQAQADAPKATQKAQRMYTSDEMSNAVEKRLKQERRGAVYQLAREMIDERMRAENCSEADAIAKIRQDRINTKAAEYKANPEKGFAELMQRMNGEETRTPETRVDNLYTAMTADIEAGKVPQGFDLNAYMSDRERARDFIELYEAFGMERACALAQRMNAPAQPTKAEQNAALPRPIDTNNAYTPAQPDIWGMSSKEFSDMEKRMKAARAQGKRVNF